MNEHDLIKETAKKVRNILSPILKGFGFTASIRTNKQYSSSVLYIKINTVPKNFIVRTGHWEYSEQATSLRTYLKDKAVEILAEVYEKNKEDYYDDILRFATIDVDFVHYIGATPDGSDSPY